MAVTTDISSIVESQPFADDVELIKDLIVNAIALEQFVDKNDPFVHVVAYLCALHRHFINQMDAVKDIDETPFLDLFRQEVGMGLPVVTNIPLVEFIREAKSWGGHKGTLGLYKFIGQLVGSPIEVNILNKKIFTLDNPNTCLDGAPSTTGILPFSESKLGYFRDGIYYAYFTYAVKVSQAQNIGNFNDLYALLDNVHVAGTKEFVELDFWNLINYSDLQLVSGSYEVSDTYFYSAKPFPSLDNGFMLDDPLSMLDQLGSFAWSNQVYIEEVRDQAFQIGYRTLGCDTLMHEFPTGDPDGIFFKWQYDPATDTYVKVYADQDADIMAVQTTNMSFSEITYGDLEERTFREFQHIAYGLRGDNPNSEWFEDVPAVTIVES